MVLKSTLAADLGAYSTVLLRIVSGENPQQICKMAILQHLLLIP